MKLYRIRNKETGLYSTGGERPRWSTVGKVWVGIGPLKNHILNYQIAHRLTYGVYFHLDDIEVVEVEMSEVGTTALQEITQQLLKDKEEKAAQAQRKWARQQRKWERGEK